MTPAAWTNGRSVMVGRWEYYWPSDTFIIHLYKGRGRRILKGYETPEWGKWRLIRNSNGATNDKSVSDRTG